MRPILCGGYYHAPRWSLRNYEVTDCPPPEQVAIYSHDPRSGQAIITYEVVCQPCYTRRQMLKKRASGERIKLNLPKPSNLDWHGKPLKQEE